MGFSNYDYSKLTKRQINKIGDYIRAHDIKYENGILIHQDEYEAVREDLDAYRYKHIRPMDDIFDQIVKLKTKHSEFDMLVAERPKRLPSILGKLHRFPTMELSQIQDLGGVRVIVNDIDQLQKLLPLLDEILPDYREKNRIKNPAPSGYRGIHRIFKRDGVAIELQIRTMLQHVWATTVESIDVLRGTSMKNGQNDPAWTEFFQLLSSIFAMSEQMPVLDMHDGASPAEIVDMVRRLNEEYQIVSQVENYSKTNFIDTDSKQYPDAYYALISRDNDKITQITYYTETEEYKAFEDYENYERSVDNRDKVLVSVDKVKQLLKAYPNYFVNLEKIAKTLKTLLDKATEVKI